MARQLSPPVWNIGMKSSVESRVVSWIARCVDSELNVSWRCDISTPLGRPVRARAVAEDHRILEVDLDRRWRGVGAGGEELLIGAAAGRRLVVGHAAGHGRHDAGGELGAGAVVEQQLRHRVGDDAVELGAARRQLSGAKMAPSLAQANSASKRSPRLCASRATRLPLPTPSAPASACARRLARRSRCQ